MLTSVKWSCGGSSTSNSRRILDRAEVVFAWTPVTFMYLLGPDHVKCAFVPRLNLSPRASSSARATGIVFHARRDMYHRPTILDLHGPKHYVSQFPPGRQIFSGDRSHPVLDPAAASHRPSEMTARHEM